MVSTDCFILQSRKLRHEEGKHPARGHQELVVELWSEPRAPLLPFHFFLSLPPLMSVSVSVQLYPRPTPERLLPGLSLPCPLAGKSSSLVSRGRPAGFRQRSKNGVCPLTSSPHYHLFPPLPFLSGPSQLQPLSLPHLVPTPTVLTRWTNQRVLGQRQAQSRLTGGGPVPDRQTDMQQAH